MEDTMREMRMESLRICLLLTCVLLFATGVLAAEPMLPLVDDGTADVNGWLMSEKLDGVRGHWDGHRLLSKHGTVLHPPREFVQGLPPFPVEGELWAGRGSFEQTAAVVRRQRPDNDWLKLKFAIFDVPEAPGGFTERIAAAVAWFAAHPTPYAFVIPQQTLRGRAQLRQELQRIEKLGGEGLIVRRPDAPYVPGRSPDILKVKSYRDAEATVIARLPGKGRNEGRLGALLVRLENGTEFRIGSGFSDAERDNPPPVGAVITFKHYGFFKSGVPRFPSYLRIRADQGL
ncbi:DNA ligase [Geothermobacter hydrogeniphilus]|uniref:DNA ligase n=2 Tax=Geothermobacter hydrogeniphilus TaxID=1969733 RepID=A0A1X0Y0F9_9BACT|nr:DNA ligase [Geothermobacter hydrogeniphilus]